MGEGKADVERGRSEEVDRPGLGKAEDQGKWHVRSWGGPARPAVKGMMAAGVRLEHPAHWAWKRRRAEGRMAPVCLGTEVGLHVAQVPVWEGALGLLETGLCGEL